MWGARGRYIATSALVIAVTCGAFVLVVALGTSLWQRDVAVRAPHRVVTVLGHDPVPGLLRGLYFGVAGLRTLAEAGVFEEVSGQIQTSGRNADYQPRLRLDQVGSVVETVAVHHRYFDLLGIAIRGRGFAEADDMSGAEPVAVISHRLWRSAFNGDEGVIGTVVDASPMPIRIVGVSEATFHGARLGEDTDVWVPSALVRRLAVPGRAQDDILFQAMGRLRDGVSLEVAEDTLSQLDGRPRRVIPINRLFGSPEHDTALVQADELLRFLPIAASLVLIAGLATLTALTVVYYDSRRQELAIRRALGASTLHVLRLLSRDATLTIILGSILTLALVSAGLRVFPSVRLPSGVDLARLEFGLDWFLFVTAIGLASAGLLVATAAPMLQALWRPTAPDIRAGGYSSTSSSHRIGRWVLAGQTAVAVVLVVVAGLFVHSIVRARGSGVGFDFEQVAFVHIRSQRQTEARAVNGRLQSVQLDATERRAKLLGLMESIRAIPGVSMLALGDAPIGIGQAARARERTESENESGYLFAGRAGPAYFDALGVRVLAGDWLRDSSADAAQAVAVTASTAARLWPGESAIGQELGSRRVHAIVEDLAIGSVTFDSRAGSFHAVDIDGIVRQSDLDFAVRMDGRSAIPIEELKVLAEGAFPLASFVQVSTGDEIVRDDMGQQMLGAWFLSLLGSVVLLICTGSIFGVLNRYTNSRRRELAVRAALGADVRVLRTLVARQAVAPIGIGLVVGAIGGFWISALMEGFLLGVERLDPVTYLAAVGVASMISVLAVIHASVRVGHVAIAGSLRVEG